MRRRTFLATTAAIGSVGLAGCSDQGDSGPKYEGVSLEDLMLPLSTFPDGWRRTDEVNDNFDGVFQNADGTIVIFIGINIHDEVSGAKDDFDTSQNEAGDVHELEIADEAYWFEREQTAITLFRDSNVESQAVGMRQSGTEIVPGTSRSQDYARELADHMDEQA
jgi:hypothetical protein